MQMLKGERYYLAKESMAGRDSDSREVVWCWEFEGFKVRVLWDAGLAFI